MTENKAAYQDNFTDSSAAQPSIQQQSPSQVRTAARGDASSAPVLFVETLGLEDLLDRAALDIETEFWPSAAAYADRALAVDPSCARAWLYKLLADLNATTKAKIRQIIAEEARKK